MKKDSIEKLEQKHRQKASNNEDDVEYHRQVARALRRSMARSSIAWWEKQKEEYRAKLVELVAEGKSDSEQADECRSIIDTCNDMLRKLEQGMKEMEEE